VRVKMKEKRCKKIGKRLITNYELEIINSALTD
jgi:hypothetical protein